VGNSFPGACFKENFIFLREARSQSQVFSGRRFPRIPSRYKTFPKSRPLHPDRRLHGHYPSPLCGKSLLEERLINPHSFCFERATLSNGVPDLRASQNNSLPSPFWSLFDRSPLSHFLVWRRRHSISGFLRWRFTPIVSFTRGIPRTWHPGS